MLPPVLIGDITYIIIWKFTQNILNNIGYLIY